MIWIGQRCERMNGEADCAFHPSACHPTDVGRDGSVRLTERNRQALSKLPNWAFAAADDEVVDPASTADCSSRLHAVNPEARMTVFEDAVHRAVPALAWLDEELGLLSWMLAQQRLICLAQEASPGCQRPTGEKKQRD